MQITLTTTHKISQEELDSFLKLRLKALLTPGVRLSSEGILIEEISAGTHTFELPSVNQDPLQIELYTAVKALQTVIKKYEEKQERLPFYNLNS